MDGKDLQQFKTHTQLTNYFPLPRSLLEMDLPNTAMLLYSILLDRATLSQKNAYTDENDWVYVIYPIENLAQRLSVCESVIKKQLKLLEEKGLIKRSRPSGNGPSQIYLSIPADSEKASPAGTESTKAGSGRSYPTGKKVPTNNKRKQHNRNDYYQHGEDESL